jgi:hypothetical protein
MHSCLSASVFAKNCFRKGGATYPCGSRSFPRTFPRSPPGGRSCPRVAMGSRVALLFSLLRWCFRSCSWRLDLHAFHEPCRQLDRDAFREPRTSAVCTESPTAITAQEQPERRRAAGFTKVAKDSECREEQKPGERRGGRKAGTPNKATVEIRQQGAAPGSQQTLLGRRSPSTRKRGRRGSGAPDGAAGDEAPRGIDGAVGPERAASRRRDRLQPTRPAVGLMSALPGKTVLASALSSILK